MQTVYKVIYKSIGTIMIMIKVILYLTVAIHLVHCWPIHSRSRRNSDSILDCSNESVAQDISEFNDIFINFWNGTNETVRLNIVVLNITYVFI